MARIATGAVRLKTESVAVAAVIEQASELVGVSATGRGQTLRTVPEEGLHVRADSDRLRQVLVNLLSNASKYTPDGGAISIAAGRSDRDGIEWAVISVTDTGPGIPPDAVESIFEPYYRMPDAEKTDGIGLGLTISRGLVRQMGGDLDVESVVGGGSTFRVWLRLTAPGE
jgi:signal transduction histidine kinase